MGRLDLRCRWKPWIWQLEEKEEGRWEDSRPVAMVVVT